MMLTARRWTRYGHDRVYVTHQDGTRIGFIDLKTGRTSIDHPDWTEEFHQVVAPYLRHGMEERTDSVLQETTPEPTEQPEPDAAPASPTTPESTDLATHWPGQGARHEADEQLAAMRSRSRFGTFVARALDVNTDERSWRKGAEGEEYVGTQLNRLYEHGWGILHSLPIGQRGSDIDHLLIGPGGVFPINTKNHPGKKVWIAPNQIRVNGQPVPYLRNSRFEGRRVGEMLSARVGWPVASKAVLVILTGTFFPQITFRSGGPQDVWILNRTQVPKAFIKLPRVLSQAQINELFAAARRPETWNTST
jgi:hypothetical protein